MNAIRQKTTAVLSALALVLGMTHHGTGRSIQYKPNRHLGRRWSGLQ